MSEKRFKLSEKDVRKGDKYFSEKFQEKIKHVGKFSITKVIGSIIKQVMSGTEFFRIQVPTDFLLPQSALEFFSLMFTPTESFLNVHEHSSSIDRMKCILEWFLINNVQNYFAGFFHVKPYNPTLGEIFTCYWPVENSTSYLICEQVSHHPPISSFKFLNEEKKIEILSTLKPESKIYLNSGSLFTTGFFKITIDKKENYFIKFPENLASGVFYGKSKIEPYGDFEISCEETNMKVKLNFSSKRKIKGDIYVGKKKVYSVSGNPVIKVFITDKETKKEELLVDLQKEKLELKVRQFCVKDIKDQQSNESRRKWLKVTKNILKDKKERAGDVKSYVENVERDKVKERKKNKEEWSPIAFERVGKKLEMECILKDEEIKQFCLGNACLLKNT